MKEIREIISAYDEAIKQNKRAALATVVHVEGSSYRRAGARMLVTDDGLITGAISGGCLEGDALRKALLAIHQNKNKLVTYDTSEEGDILGVHLGCNGVVHILFEPVDPSRPELMEALRTINWLREPVALLTIFSYNPKIDQPGTVGWINQHGEHLFSEALLDKRQMSALVNRALHENLSLVEQLPINGMDFQLSVQVMQPSVRLIIFGAGNDTIPLAEMGRLLGWSVTIIDGRPTHANKNRFPYSDEIIVSKPSAAVAGLKLDRNTAIVLMTHNYNYELAVLKELLHKDFSYLGILGPRKKFERMKNELLAQGLVTSLTQESKIHSPVGLELGAETSEEIALSIAAEVKAVLSGKKAISLKDKPGPIHQRRNENVTEAANNE